MQRNEEAEGARAAETDIESLTQRLELVDPAQAWVVKQDAFLVEGYRRMASNMIALAIRDVLRARAPGVSGSGKVEEHNGQAAVRWLHGMPAGALSFEACCAALQMDDWKEGLAEFILHKPQKASAAFIAYERSVCDHAIVADIQAEVARAVADGLGDDDLHDEGDRGAQDPSAYPAMRA
jgi:hypothetical protein